MNQYIASWHMKDGRVIYTKHSIPDNENIKDAICILVSDANWVMGDSINDDSIICIKLDEVISFSVSEQ